MLGFEEEEEEVVAVVERREKRRKRMAMAVTDAASNRIGDLAAFVAFPFEDPL